MSLRRAANGAIPATEISGATISSWRLHIRPLRRRSNAPRRDCYLSSHFNRLVCGKSLGKVMPTYVDHYSGVRQQDRKTPRIFFERLHARFNFTLDGAASDDNALLPRYVTPQDPRMTWSCERVFCNPPWSNIPPFVELAATAAFACLLVPARTNCKWFHRALELGARTEFWLGKLSFDGPWNSPVDCLLLIFDNHQPTPVHHPEE